MTFFPLLCHFGFLALWVRVTYHIARVHLDARRPNVNKNRVQSAIVKIWLLPGAYLIGSLLAVPRTPAAWFFLIVGGLIWSFACFIASGYLFPRLSDASGPLAVLLLIGLQLGYQGDLAAYQEPRRPLVTVLCLIILFSLTAIGVRYPACLNLVRQKRRAWCVVLGFALGLALIQNALGKAAGPAFAPATVAFLLATSYALARDLQRRPRAGPWTARFGDTLVVCCVVGGVIPVLTRDFSVALLVASCLVVLLLAYKQSAAAVAATGLIGLLLGVIYATSRIPKLNERIDILLRPQLAVDSQVDSYLWAQALGQSVGRGAGRWVTAIGNPPKPMIPLPGTDGVFAGLAHTTGVLGVTLTLFSFLILILWLLRRADTLGTQPDLWGAVFFRVTAHVCAVTVLAAGAWVSRCFLMVGFAAPLITYGYWVNVLWAVVLACVFAHAIHQDGLTQERPDLASPPGVGAAVLPLTPAYIVGERVLLSLLFALLAARYLCVGITFQPTYLAHVYTGEAHREWLEKALAASVFEIKNNRVQTCDPPPKGWRKKSLRERAAYAAHIGLVRIDTKSGTSRLTLAPPGAFYQTEPTGIVQLLRDAGWKP